MLLERNAIDSIAFFLSVVYIYVLAVWISVFSVTVHSLNHNQLNCGRWVTFHDYSQWKIPRIPVNFSELTDWFPNENRN